MQSINDKNPIKKLLILNQKDPKELDFNLILRTGLIILAGGQGSRLGFDGPKGAFKLEKIGKSIFDVYFGKIKKIEKEYGDYFEKSKKKLSVFVMCSEFTLEDTKKILKDLTKNLDLKYTDTYIFAQDSLKVKDIHYNNIYKNSTDFQTAPNGNGGLIFCIHKLNLVEMFKEKEINVINIITVDNILNNFFDLKVIKKFYDVSSTKDSYKVKLLEEVDIISKGVEKHEGENAGVFCVKDKRLVVVEYNDYKREKESSTENKESEIKESGNKESGNKEIIKESENGGEKNKSKNKESEIKESKNKKSGNKKSEIKGEKKNIANICHHYMNINFLYAVFKMPEHSLLLKKHVAFKKIDYYDEKTQKIVKPEEINGIKYEYFIFDIFDYSNEERNLVYEVNRSEEFSPLKNAEGKDSIKTCQEDYLALLKKN